jgi:proline iminopeptidase
MNYTEHTIKVSEIHTLAYTIHGDPKGKPVIFIHGGPGGGTSHKDVVYFDLQIYRVICLDQRGAGKSTPNAELEENNTHELVEDCEKVSNQA